MDSPLLIPAMLTMAAGTYLFRLAGPALRDRVRFPPRAARLLEIAAVILLAALVATTALPFGDEFGWALPAGVLIGGVLAWRRCPLLIVIAAAAATTAALRAVGIA
ncbi:AzlD domain-containing protein [Nocardia cyriacigeorgica]|uniref:AzlD domain-containing protein n=1 Tax=Nocardia cyriacigeorgica TaxID=135487 RepID=A0A6P1D3D6_9NOCA|nr:AzlD domain-containing protein [Nocardia cyriacigeorgica]NEW40714.1 AzlD domain-containing protein [Nocardia cyriacigeorgica]NEW44039.1 AzlD domain-containing protein [Nocardia cyriacigeorgica]NEW51058.1 AzlD domain-containing protein [Nocardia cyriacigeorgica]NEW54358.1 AzlD domain-containing protein [Nocardia cyriacigeorgica]